MCLFDGRSNRSPKFTGIQPAEQSIFSHKNGDILLMKSYYEILFPLLDKLNSFDNFKDK